MSKIYGLIAAVTLLAALNSPAASGNWNVDAGGNWSAAGNWSPAVVPGTAAGETVGLTFNISAARTITIDTASRTVGTLNIGDPSSSYSVYTLAASGGGTLTFDNSGSGALLSKQTAANNVVDTISAPITLADNLFIDSAAIGDSVGTSLLISGVIGETGTRSITKNGSGGVQLSGANTFSGGIVLNAGILHFGRSSTLDGSGNIANGPLGTGTLTINNDTMIIARGASRTLHNALSIAGNVFIGTTNGNQVTLAGPADLNGGVRTITVGAGSSDPDSIMSGPVSNGGLTIVAAGGNLQFNGVNTYSGDTRIASGTLLLSTNAAAPAGTCLALQNSTLDMNAADSGTLSFRGSHQTVAATLGGLKGTRNVNLANTQSGAVALTVGNNGQSTVYSGVLSGGGSLIKTNTGTLVLSGANTYTGSTTISGGSLQLGDGGSTGSLFASGYIQNDGNLTINRNNAVVQGVDFGGGSITGAGSFTQAGSGTTTLNLANYTGATTVSAGKLLITSELAATGAASVADGATLGITTSSGQWSPATLTLGASTGCTLEFNNIANVGTSTAPLHSGSVTRNAPVTINVNSISGAITVGGSGYPLVANAGAVTNGYTLGTRPPGVGGHLAISGTTLTFIVDTVSDIWNAAAPGGNWDIGSTADWTGNAVNNSPVNTYKDGDNVLFNDTVSGPQAVTLTAAVAPGKVNVDNTATDYTITSSGANSIGGANGLGKSGAGSLTLSGPNTYSGGTTLSAGQLNINDGGTSSANSAIGTGPLTLTGGSLGNTSGGDVTLLPNNPQNWNGDFGYAGSGFNLNLGTGAVTPNANRQVNVSANTLTVGGVIGGGAISLTKTGNGVLTLSGANTFSGGMTLLAGQLNLGNGSAIGTGPLTLTGGTIDNTSGSDMTLVPNNAQVWSGNFTYAGSANNLNLGTGAVNLGTATRTVTVNGNTLTVGGVITGTGGLTKSGSGTLVLSAANVFSGTLSINGGGPLAIGNDRALGTGSLNFNSTGATIQSSDSTARTITNTLSFTGQIEVIFGGTGNLKFTGPLPANNTTDKTVTVNNPVTELAGSGWGGASGRTVNGPGKLILSGALTHTRLTTINSGATLQLGNGGATGGVSASSAIVNYGTLIFNRTNNVVQGVDFGSAPITGSGNIIQAGTGITTLNAANSYSGTTLVSSGKLVISSAQTGVGAITVANGAKLGIAVSGVSQLAPSTLTLGTSATTTLEWDGVYSTSIPPVNVGTLSVGGQVTVNINSGTFVASNSYPLMHWTGGGPLNANAFVLGNAPGLTAALSVSNSILYLYVSGVENRQRILKVYLQAGQSNSDGRALTNGLPSNILQPQVDVPLYYYLDGGAANGDGTLGTLATLRPGISAYGSGTLFGPELTFGRTLADYYALTNGVSTNTVTVAIIKYAHGNTSLFADWAANGNATTNGDGPDFVIFQQVVSAGLSRLASAYPGASIELDGMIWVQGEADTGGSTSAANYGKNLTRFINDVRLTYATNHPYGTNLPFFLSRISANQHYMNPADSSYSNCLVLRAGQESTTTNLSNVFMIDTDPAEFSTVTPYSLPGTHFDTQGQQALGAAFGRSVIAALPPPVFQMPERASNGWSLQFSGVSGTSHSVERAGSVTGPWTAMTNIVIDATGIANFADPAPLNPACFYRASRP